MPGTDIAVRGFGKQAPPVLSSIRSDNARSTPVIGHYPVFWICFVIRFYSKMCPDFTETTGCYSGNPESAQLVTDIKNY